MKSKLANLIIINPRVVATFFTTSLVALGLFAAGPPLTKYVK